MSAAAATADDPRKATIYQTVNRLATRFFHKLPTRIAEIGELRTTLISAPTDRQTLAELRPWELHNAALRKTGAINLPNGAAAHEKDQLAARMNRRRKRMDRRTLGELADLALRESRLE